MPGTVTIFYFQYFLEEMVYFFNISRDQRFIMDNKLKMKKNSASTYLFLIEYIHRTYLGRLGSVNFHHVALFIFNTIEA